MNLKFARRAALASAIMSHGLAMPFARGSLNIDVRATSITGPGTLVSSKQAINVQVGTVVRFDVFATVIGTNASLADDKFIAVSGSFRSGAIGTQGTLQLDLVRSVTDSNGDMITPGFDGPNSSAGLQQNLDGDSDLDVGSNTDSDPANFWCAQYALAPEAASAGTANPVTGGCRIGFGTFTVTAPFGTAARINFEGRNAPLAAQYVQDGVAIQEPSIQGLLWLEVRGVPEPSILPPALGAAITLRRSRHRPLRGGRPAGESNPAPHSGHRPGEARRS